MLTPDGRKEIFKQEFLVEKSKDVQRLNPAFLSCLITISIKSAAWDGTGFKESMCLLQSMNIPKAWSTPRRKKTWSGELRLTLDITAADPQLDRPIRKRCSPWVDEPIAASTAGSHVSHACAVTTLEVITHMQMKQRKN